MGQPYSCSLSVRRVILSGPTCMRPPENEGIGHVGVASFHLPSSSELHPDEEIVSFRSRIRTPKEMIRLHPCMLACFLWMCMESILALPMQYEMPSESTLAAGDRGLHILQTKARMEGEGSGLARTSQEGSCWKSALDTLTGGCKDMGEKEVRRFALQLTSCDLVSSGGEAIPCDPGTDLNDCLSGIQDHQAIWTSYTNNMQQAMAICIYVLHRNFRSSTADMINFMYENTGILAGGLAELRIGMVSSIGKLVDVQGRMDNLSAVQDYIYKHAQSSLLAQKKLSAEQTELLRQTKKIKQIHKENQRGLEQVLRLHEEELRSTQLQLGTMLESTRQFTSEQEAAIVQSMRGMQGEVGQLLIALANVREDFLSNQMETRTLFAETNRMLLAIMNTSSQALEIQSLLREEQQASLALVNDLKSSYANGQKQLAEYHAMLTSQVEDMGRIHIRQAEGLEQRLTALGKQADQAAEKHKHILYQSGKLSEAQSQMQQTIDSLNVLQTRTSNAITHLLGRNYRVEDIIWFVCATTGIIMLSNVCFLRPFCSSMFFGLACDFLLERLLFTASLSFLINTLGLPIGFVMHDLKWYTRYFFILLCLLQVLVRSFHSRRDSSDYHRAVGERWNQALEMTDETAAWMSLILRQVIEQEQMLVINPSYASPHAKKYLSQETGRVSDGTEYEEPHPKQADRCEEGLEITKIQRMGNSTRYKRESPGYQPELPITKTPERRSERLRACIPGRNHSKQQCHETTATGKRKDRIMNGPQTTETQFHTSKHARIDASAA